MAWLSGYANAQQKIIDEESEYIDFLSFSVAAGETPPVFNRTVTISKYRYIGMTYVAAAECKEAINSPPDVIATMQRASDAANYYVSVMEISRGAWAEV